ncbi:unnamed protein product, partial [Mesorhabditis belari]|uniref:Uncharacterized protein n=1 Tax=Mesorhabditis belari TaxID=2138241 RepID=A0AAF3FHN7_9BILA
MRYYVPAQGPSLTLPQLAIHNAQRMQTQPQGFVLPLTTYSGAPLGVFSEALPPVPLSYYPTLDYRNPGLLPVPQINYPSFLYPSMASVSLETPSLPAGMVPVGPTGGFTRNLAVFGEIPLQQPPRIPIQTPPAIPIPLQESRIPIQTPPAIPILLQESRIPIQTAPGIPIPLQEPRIPIQAAIPMPLPAPDFPQLPTYLQPQLNNSIPVLNPIASFPVVVNPQREEFTTSKTIANFDTEPTTRSVTIGKTSAIPSWQYLAPISTTPIPSTSLPTTRSPLSFLTAIGHSAIGQFQDATTQRPRFTFTFRPVSTTPIPTTTPKMSTFPLNVNTQKSLQQTVPRDQIFRFNLTSLAPTQTTTWTPILKDSPINRVLEKTNEPNVGPLKIGSQWGDRLQGKPFAFPNQFNFFVGLTRKDSKDLSV